VKKNLFFKARAIGLAMALLFPIPPAHAAEFAFATESGVLTGTTNEYVYEGDKCISRLDWKDSAIPALSFSGQAALFGAFLRLEMTSAVPAQNGTMEDYDFLVAGSDEPSLYSQHDAYLDKYFDGSVMLGYDLRLSNWRIMPSAGFAYRNRKWTAADGFLQYPVSGLWTGDEPKQDLYGPVISYEQALWFPVITLKAGYTLGKRFLFSASGSLYPVMWGDTIDNHLLRSEQFYDTMREGFGGNINAGFQYNFGGKERIVLEVSAGYEKVALKGNTAMKETGVSDSELVITEGYGSRMESGQWRFTLGLVCRFGGRPISCPAAAGPLPRLCPSAPPSP
jgi:outer membrane protease